MRFHFLVHELPHTGKTRSIYASEAGTKQSSRDVESQDMVQDQIRGLSLIDEGLVS